MSVTAEQDVTAEEAPFSLTVDPYGRLWLYAKLEGFPIMVDLAEKEAAFQIMAAQMAECGFQYRPVQEHQQADNDVGHAWPSL